MRLLSFLGIDATEAIIRLLLANSPKHRRWALRAWNARRNPLKLAPVIAEILADREGIDVPPGTPADQVIGALVAHAYEPHVRRALTREYQQPPSDAEVRCALLGVQAMVEGILPKCE